MDLAYRYSVIVQVITRDHRDLFYGLIPELGMETYELVDPGNLSQEFMFYRKLRRMIAESLSVYTAENKAPPSVQNATLLTTQWKSSPSTSEPSSQPVSTRVAAHFLKAHPDTIRVLFDEGYLKGSLSPHGKRMIEMTSLEEEKERRQQRTKMRRLEFRNQKKNAKRKLKRTQKKRARNDLQLKLLHPARI